MLYFKISLNTKDGEIKSLGLVIFNAQYSIIPIRVDHGRTRTQKRSTQISYPGHHLGFHNPGADR